MASLKNEIRHSKMAACLCRKDSRFSVAIFGVAVVLLHWLNGTDAEKYFFNIERQYRITNGTLIRSVNRQNMTSSMCASFCTPTCWTATYSKTEHVCMTFRERIYKKAIFYVADSDWNILTKVVTETVTRGDWTMVFRSQRGVGLSVYDTWLSSGTHNDRPVGNNITTECLGIQYDTNCRKYFRSFFLDEWEETKISQIKYSIYKNGVEVQHIIFDGRDTTFNSWFSIDKIISSSWNVTSLRTMEWFSIDGFAKNNNYHRRFYIVYQHNKCATDETFTMVIDESNEPCSGWHLNLDYPPVILYSPMTGYANLASQEYDYADVMAVYIKLDIF